MSRKLILIGIVSLGLIFGFTIKSNAAVQIVPVASNKVTVNTTVSKSYELSRGMTNRGESLYGSEVLPHLVTNADWGAVSYLANSIYGSNGEYQNLGTDNVKVTISNIEHYSTTGNITGVMNWGSNPNKEMRTQTASLISAYVSEPTGSTNVTSLYDNINSWYVEIINTINSSFSKDTTRGQAFKETAGWYSEVPYSGTKTSYPTVVRKGLFRFGMGGNWFNSQWLR